MIVLTLNLFRKLFQLINSFSSKDWQFQLCEKGFCGESGYKSKNFNTRGANT